MKQTRSKQDIKLNIFNCTKFWHYFKTI